MSKILTVFGATGNQGGSVVKVVLGHPQLSKQYKIRAVTRDVSKPAAVALKEQGAELVTADLNDTESLKKAIEGSSVVFGVTNFWEALDPAVETQQGKNIADAALAAKVDRFIFSSLVNVSTATNGANTRVKHFDSKARVEEHARKIGLPSTFYLPAVFMPFILSSFKPHHDGSGAYAWTSPLAETAQVPLVDAAADTGKFVAAVLLNLDATLGQRVLGTAGYVTPQQLVAQFAEATGEKAVYNQVPYEVFKGFLPPPMADELTANFELIDSPGYYAGEPADAVERSIKLVTDSADVPAPTSWKDYVKANFQK